MTRTPRLATDNTIPNGWHGHAGHASVSGGSSLIRGVRARTEDRKFDHTKPFRTSAPPPPGARRRSGGARGARAHLHLTPRSTSDPPARGARRVMLPVWIRWRS